MRTSMSMKLLKALHKGKEQLGTEAIHKITGFVESQRTEEDAFKDKNGKTDLYYTSFGWMLSYILGIKADQKKRTAYLAKQDADNLDMIHYAAYTRCRMTKLLNEKGKTGLLLQSLRSTHIKALHEFSGLPHNDLYSPYTQFVWLSLLEDTGHSTRHIKENMDALINYHLPEGGFMNTPDGLTATTNATVAALAVRGQLSGYTKNKDVFYLRGLQDTSGGFGASKASPVPDLLSTATSLFILSCYGIKPIYAARDFIEAHWQDTGGFSATIFEDRSDVEYTFYGILALGTVGN